MWKDALKKRKAMTREELADAKERLRIAEAKASIKRTRERYMKLSPEEKAKYDASFKEAQDRVRRNAGFTQDADGKWRQKKDKE